MGQCQHVDNHDERDGDRGVPWLFLSFVMLKQVKFYCQGDTSFWIRVGSFQHFLPLFHDTSTE